MDSILHEMLSLWEAAVKRGVPAHAITFTFSPTGFAHYLGTLVTEPKLAQRLKGIQVELVAHQIAEVELVHPSVN